MIGIVHERSRTAAAACRNWSVVRGSSISANRGEAGKPLSVLAMATNSSARASMRSAKRSKKDATISSPIAAICSAAWAAASMASSTSLRELTG